MLHFQVKAIRSTRYFLLEGNPADQVVIFDRCRTESWIITYPIDNNIKYAE